MRALQTALFLTLLALSGAPVALASTETVALDIRQSGPGTLYVQALLNNGVAADLLLDTGSSYVSLSQDTYRRISKTASPIFSRHIYGALANGKVVKVPLYFLSDLKLSENCILHDIEVAVFPGGDTDILGLNALERLQPFTLQLTPAKMISTCTS